MIVVQDRIEVDACRLHQLQELFHQRYLEAATARELEYIDATVSPPVKLTREPVVLSLRWQVADAPAGLDEECLNLMIQGAAAA